MPNNRVENGNAQFVLAMRAREALGQTDGQLLRRFVNAHDEAAFAALVGRHGPIVFGVCRRILGNVADAEDAFQATILVLVRKARSLQSRGVLGDWLHGVARRTALKAKGAAAKRRLKEQAMARPEAPGEESRDDWLALLDDELSGLPEKYRLPIVLCDLEGRTRQEAAKHLGWPEGTVAGRLARARTMLAKRLARRGLTLSAGAFAAALPTSGVSAHVPAMLVANTVKAAVLLAAGESAVESVISAKVATLMGEVMKAMLVSKLKTAATLVVVCLLGGFGWVGYSTLSENVAGEIQRADRTPRDGQHAANEPVPERTEKEGDGEAVAEIVTNLHEPGSSARQLMANLMEPIRTERLQDVTTMKDLIEQFDSDFRAKKGQGFPILVNTNGFKEENPDGPDIYDTPVKFPKYPKAMTAATALKYAISFIPAKAGMVIRDGYIEITTEKRASTSALLQEKVLAHFEKRPFSDVVHYLADMSGISINLDPQIDEKAKTPITATFRNDVTLGAALRIICDMAGLKMVDMKPGLYITTPAHALELASELRDVKMPPVGNMAPKDKKAN